MRAAPSRLGLLRALEEAGSEFAEAIALLRACGVADGLSYPVGVIDRLLLQAHRAVLHRDPEVVAACRRLRGRLPTALLTNNIREWRDNWRRVLPTDELFDVVVDSSEVGMRKPEPPIYRLVEERLGIPGSGLLFVDDLGVNLKAAMARGWQTVKYDDTANVLAILHSVWEQGAGR